MAIHIGLIGFDISDEIVRHQLDSNVIDIITVAGDLLKIGYWQLKLQPEKLFWSDSLYKIHGVEKLSYKPTLESALKFYHPDDVGKIRELIKSAINDKIGWISEPMRLITASGKEIYAISSGQVKTNSNGEVKELYGIFQDVTENESMLLERDFLVMALKETLVGMAVADENKKVIWVNKSFENMTGYKFEEIVGKKLGPILQGKNTSQKAIKTISANLATKKPVKQRILNYHKNGSAYWNELLITPVKSDRGIDYFFAIQNDVTVEVEATSKLIELNKNLHKEVEERTKSLTRLNQELETKANVDSLTGCLNRRTLMNCYSSMIEEMETEGEHQSISIVLLDIDHFKSINDTWGHHVGDIVLQSVPKFISKAIRNSDTLFRIGGEEFLILLPNTNVEVGAKISERIRQSIDGAEIEANSKVIKTTASIGCFSHNGTLTLDESLQIVDELLYRAKELGRNQVVSTIKSELINSN